MSLLINPATARLGITRFWTVNYPITLHSKYPILENYKLQSYLYSLDFYAHWYFADRYKRLFYLNMFLIYDRIMLNQVGFPSKDPKTLSKLTVSICFYDFYLHVNSFLNLWPLVQKTRALMSDKYYITKQTKMFTDLYKSPNIKIFISFFEAYISALKESRKYIKKFYSVLHNVCMHYKVYHHITIIHKHFFPIYPVQFNFVAVPYSGFLTAKFVAIYLERKLRTGTPLGRTLFLVRKYLRRSKIVVGYRITVAGRFKRGKKGGYFYRRKGIFAYGRYDSKFLLDYGTSSAEMNTGLVGFKVYLCLRLHRKKGYDR
jgi:hypothetical protein